MKNYWRLFAELVTELKGNYFLRTRLTLSFFITFSTVAIILILIPLASNSKKHVLESILRERLPGESSGFYIETTKKILNDFNLSEETIPLWILFFIIAGGVNYYLTGRGLQPLRQSIEAQKRFIADSSHELRTPLSIMKTNSEIALLEGPNLSSEEAIATLKSNLEEIDRMSNILQNLMHLSQVERRSSDFPLSKVNLSEALTHSIHSIERLAAKKNIKIIVARLDSSAILGNTTALEELCVNLLKNAINYSQEESSVTVSIKNNYPQDTELEISDTGIGIATKDLPHIFQPFYKADRSRNRRAGENSGLGLTIVKEIVKRHRATIQVKSTVGKGTSFIIKFPAFRERRKNYETNR